MANLSETEMRTLDKLHNIHMQSYVLLEFIILISVILCILWLSYKIYHSAQINAARRTGLSLLKQIELRRDIDENVRSSLIIDILKRVALAYYPRTKVAGLQGQAWLDFLNINAKHVDFYRIRELLLVLPYQNSQRSKISDPADMQLLCLYAKRWIKQQPVVKRR